MLLFVFTVISASPSSQTAGKAEIPLLTGFPGGSDSKESACNAGEVQSLSQEDPLEREMATHFSIFAWRIPWTGKPGRLQSMGSAKTGM